MTKDEVMIPVSDGIELSAELFVPEGDENETFPALLGTHPYNREFQTDTPLTITTAGSPGWSESGDPNFYVRRGYAMANVNLRGTENPKVSTVLGAVGRSKTSGTWSCGSPIESGVTATSERSECPTTR